MLEIYIKKKHQFKDLTFFFKKSQCSHNSTPFYIINKTKNKNKKSNMKPAVPKKWYIKDINPHSTKRLALTNCSPGDRPSQPLQNTFTSFAVTPNELQAVGSSRTSKRKPNQTSSYKQHRPPSAEITSRNPNPPVVNPLSTSSKLRPKPIIYNVTSPKIKVKTQNNPFSSSQRSFPSTSFSKPVVKAKTCNELTCEAKIDKTEQASKSTQCVNESSKSIQQLNETSLTIKAENPENSTKNVPLVSPVNQMMRRLTLSEKEKNGDSGSKSSGVRPKADEENIFSVQNGGDSVTKSSGVRPFMRESEAEKKKVQVRSYSQNPKPPMGGSANTYSPEPHAKIKVGSLQIGSPKKLDNPLQKITNLVREISELEGNGDYDRMRNYVKELEDKITDLKSSIELNGRNQRKPNIFFYGENKENKQMLRETQYPVASENGLNNLVTSVRSQVRTSEQKESKINVIQVQNLISSNMNNQKHQYPKSTTNADLQRKKFDFQNKPVSIKIQTINPQEELIPEEPQVSISQEHSGGTCRLMSPNVEKMRRPLRYYISNAVNSFYRPLNMYEDSCEDNYFSQLCQEHMMQTFQSLHLSRNLFNNMENHCYKEKCFELEKRESHKFKKTLIFDLDETLVHCNESLELPADIVLPIIFPNGQKIEVIYFF